MCFTVVPQEGGAAARDIGPATTDAAPFTRPTDAAPPPAMTEGTGTGPGTGTGTGTSTVESLSLSPEPGASGTGGDPLSPRLEGGKTQKSKWVRCSHGLLDFSLCRYKEAMIHFEAVINIRCRCRGAEVQVQVQVRVHVAYFFQKQ